MLMHTANVSNQLSNDLRINFSSFDRRPLLAIQIEDRMIKWYGREKMKKCYLIS